jgi:MFS transporter, SIT family, siderophore-iron:H+ symporter
MFSAHHITAMILVLVEVIIADMTSTRSRLFFSYIPATPFLINTWGSGPLAQDVLATTTWHWGVGMWCIIYPVCALPLILTLFIIGRRARRTGLLNQSTTSRTSRSPVTLFWQLDVPGVLLLIAVFALILTPFTLAGGFASTWKRAHIIAPLVVGFLCIPLLLVWELRFAPHPLLPIRLMSHRGIWAPLGIALCLNWAWGLQADYLYTVLVVAFDFSISGATRIVNLYSFVSVISGTILGLVIFKLRRLKPPIVAGVCLFMVALGLMVHYRGDTSSSLGSQQAGVIGAQVLLGFAGGLFPYPAQASLQVQVPHEHVAVMTGLYLATYNVGSAFGYTVSGALWTQVLPGELERRLAFVGNETLAAAAYSNPFLVATEYPMGTEAREGLVGSYQYIQKLLCIAGLCLCVPLLVFALLVKNPRLVAGKQTLAKEENESESEVEGGAMGASEEVRAQGTFKWKWNWRWKM